jgi:hypothetical protein
MKASIPQLVIAVLIVCLGSLHNAQAVSPPPDGGYSAGNTAEGGAGTLFSLTTGSNNTAVGSQALNSLTNGNQNTATGAQALKNNTASGNTADGFQALVRNTTGTENTATGWRALFTNINGSSNTANGDGALYSNTVGFSNTATGHQALFRNTSHSFNTADGANALYDNTGCCNTAVGAMALTSNTSGQYNTATGMGALSTNTTGSANTADGVNALGGTFQFGNGSNNTAVGVNALVGEEGDLQNNTAVGADTLPLGAGGGQNNIAIGYLAGSNLASGDYNIDVGNPGDPVSGDGYTIRIGDVQMRTFIAAIYGTTTGSTTTLPVIVDSNGQLGTAVSSERFKKDIKPMDDASQSILALKPVSFHYKSDRTNTPQFGLVAEQVAAVNDALIVRDKNGNPYTVRYDQVNAMLLNEFLKEHKTVQEQGAIIAQQRKDFSAALAQQQKEIEALTAGLQKVSAQLELNKPAPQTVLNNH